jgi:hypothetical protein
MIRDETNHFTFHSCLCEYQVLRLSNQNFFLLAIINMFKISATLMVVNVIIIIVTIISNANHCIFFLGGSII